ncbi:hypothetical protein GTY86_15640 [Streptomyces sp. SID5770]|uniref:DUF6480 family protein n=1 Tax=Streptomyces sp. SID5770 TaxID=2690308 RepID=UPI00136F662A|nr:DUF6480 family protein [Streptomyces sp. SID5770]MZE52692.1 hypothetical protein [Streptomyces sp. SID5770]
MTRPSNPDPEPRDIPGVDVGGGTGTPGPGAGGGTGAPGAGGGVAPGETPPAESGTGTGTGPYRPLRRGWATGPLLALWILVVLCALFFLAYAIILATD